MKSIRNIFVIMIVLSTFGGTLFSQNIYRPANQSSQSPSTLPQRPESRAIPSKAQQSDSNNRSSTNNARQAVSQTQTQQSARQLSATKTASPTKDSVDMRPVDLKSKRMFPVPVGDSTGYALVGDVILYHNGAVITCDSLVRYNDRKMECFGNVVINKDSTYIYGDVAQYDGEINSAQVFSPLIKVKDGDATLYTYGFKFDTKENIGEFYDGGTLLQNQNQMEADKGYYYSDTKDVIGVDRVELRNENYQMKSDSVRYNMDTETASFYTRSNIWNTKGEILSADRGDYFNKEDKYRFRSSAYILTADQEIWADSIDYAATAQDMEMWHNIQANNSKDKVMAFGNYAKYVGEIGDGVLTDDPALISYDTEQSDTVYVRADSIFIYLVDSLGLSTLTRKDSTYLNSLEESKKGISALPDEELIVVDSVATANSVESSPSAMMSSGTTNDTSNALSDTNSDQRPISAEETSRPDAKPADERRRGRRDTVGNNDQPAAPRPTDQDNIVEVTGIESSELTTDTTNDGVETQQFTADTRDEGTETQELTTGTTDRGTETQGLTTDTADRGTETQELTTDTTEDADNQATAKLSTEGSESSEGSAQPATMMSKEKIESEGNSTGSLALSGIPADSLALSSIPTDSLALSGIPADSLPEPTMLADSLAIPVNQADTTQQQDRIVLAYGNVKVFRSDFQAVCDSLLAFTADSTIQMHLKPVLWNDVNQIVSDRVDVETKNQKPSKAVFSGGSPIMSSELDTTRYNQVAGKTITSYFDDGAMYRTDVNGNARTYYYITDDSDGAVMGFLVSECSDITFYIDDNTIQSIVWRNNPTYSIYPMTEIPRDQPQMLPEFDWLIARKPSKEEVFDKTINNSERDYYEALPQPLFPITNSIDQHRKILVESGAWADREDEITDETREFITTREPYEKTK